MLRGWYRDLWETQHGKEDNSQRLEALEKENAKLKETAAELEAAALKQKQAEEEKIRHLQEEITRLKSQNVDIMDIIDDMQVPPQLNLVRSKTLPANCNEQDRNEDYLKMVEMKSALKQDEADSEFFRLKLGRRHFW